MLGQGASGGVEYVVGGVLTLLLGYPIYNFYTKFLYKTEIESLKVRIPDQSFHTKFFIKVEIKTPP